MADDEIQGHAQVEDDWTTWSDSELRARLIRRGADPVQVKGWVRDREHEEAIDEIKAILAVEILGPDDKPVRLETSLERRTGR